MYTSRIPLAHKVRTTCDGCRKAKMRCSRGSPCEACFRSGNECRYSVSSRLGRPPGAASRVKGVNTTTKRGRVPRRPAPTTAVKPSIPDSDSQSHDLPAVDNVLMHVSSDLKALSSSEILGNQDSVNLGAHYIPNTSSIKDDKRPWADLGQFQRASLAETQLRDGTNNDLQPTYDDDSLLLSASGSRCIGCSCLQQHTRFLSYLIELDRRRHVLFIAATLDAANRCMHLWGIHLCCRSCWRNEDNSALLVLLMCMGRVVKRLLLFLSYRKSEKEPIRGSLGAGLPAVSETGVLEGASPKANAQSDVRSGEGIYSERPRYEPEIPLITAPPMKILIGEFQVPEEEHMFIVGMLIIRMLTRIKEGLKDIRNKIIKVMRDDNNRNHQNGDFSPRYGLVPLELDHLDQSVLTLETSLGNFISS